MTKWVIYFVLEEIKLRFPQYERVFTKIDSCVAKALSEMSPLLRPLKQGFTSMTFASFEEWKSVFIVFLPAVSMICSGTHIEETVAAFHEFRVAARKKNHTESSLPELNAKCKKVKTLLITNFIHHSPSNMSFHKMHDIEHIALSISEYGALTHTSAQLEEHAHQENTKVPYKQSNRREAESQMAKVLWRKDVLKALTVNDPHAQKRLAMQACSNTAAAPQEVWSNSRKRIFSDLECHDGDQKRFLQPSNAVYMSGPWGQGSTHHKGIAIWFPLCISSNFALKFM